MDWGSAVYLGVSFGLLIIFAVIVIRTYRRNNKQKYEDPKHRMLDDD